jgi:hypothetical protein
MARDQGQQYTTVNSKVKEDNTLGWFASYNIIPNALYNPWHATILSITRDHQDEQDLHIYAIKSANNDFLNQWSNEFFKMISYKLSPVKNIIQNQLKRKDTTRLDFLGYLLKA